MVFALKHLERDVEVRVAAAPQPIHQVTGVADLVFHGELGLGAKRRFSRLRGHLLAVAIVPSRVLVLSDRHVHLGRQVVVGVRVALLGCEDHLRAVPVRWAADPVALKGRRPGQQQVRHEQAAQGKAEHAEVVSGDVEAVKDPRLQLLRKEARELVGALHHPGIALRRTRVGHRAEIPPPQPRRIGDGHRPVANSNHQQRPDVLSQRQQPHRLERRPEIEERVQHDQHADPGRSILTAADDDPKLVPHVPRRQIVHLRVGKRRLIVTGHCTRLRGGSTTKPPSVYRPVGPTPSRAGTAYPSTGSGSSPGRSRRCGSGWAGSAESISRPSRCPSQIASAISRGATQSPTR